MGMHINLSLGFLALGASIVTIGPSAQAQQTNPAPPPAAQPPDQGTVAPPAPSTVAKGGVVKPPDVDPAMSKPVPNVDPGIDKPPANMVKPGVPSPKSPPDVQPR